MQPVTNEQAYQERRGRFEWNYNAGPSLNERTHRRGRRGWHPMKWINRIVLAVGYCFIAYELVRGIVYLLVLWEEASPS